MAADNIDATLGLYPVDADKTIPAYVSVGSPPNQTDVWFRHCEYKGKEFVVIRFGADDTRVFVPATGKQLRDYLDN